MQEEIVIIGAGQAGAQVAQSLRQGGFRRTLAADRRRTASALPAAAAVEEIPGRRDRSGRPLAASAGLLHHQQHRSHPEHPRRRHRPGRQTADASERRYAALRQARAGDRHQCQVPDPAGGRQDRRRHAAFDRGCGPHPGTACDLPADRDHRRRLYRAGSCRCGQGARQGGHGSGSPGPADETRGQPDGFRFFQLPSQGKGDRPQARHRRSVHRGRRCRHRRQARQRGGRRGGSGSRGRRRRAQRPARGRRRT
jgi:hypothetical protein